MTKLTLIAAAALAPVATTAFSPIAPVSVTQISSKPAAVVGSSGLSSPLFAEVEDKAAESAFLPPEESAVDEDATFAKVESLGKGSAKVSFWMRLCVHVFFYHVCINDETESNYATL